jgi:hypothetical protein
MLTHNVHQTALHNLRRLICMEPPITASLLLNFQQHGTVRSVLDDAGRP